MLAWLSRVERISCCRWSCIILKTNFVLRLLFKGLGPVLESTLFVSHPAPPDLLKYALIKNLNPAQVENNVVLVLTSHSLGLVLVPVHNVTI